MLDFTSNRTFVADVTALLENFYELENSIIRGDNWLEVKKE